MVWILCPDICIHLWPVKFYHQNKTLYSLMFTMQVLADNEARGASIVCEQCLPPPPPPALSKLNVAPRHDAVLYIQWGKNYIEISLGLGNFVRYIRYFVISDLVISGYHCTISLQEGYLECGWTGSAIERWWSLAEGWRLSGSFISAFVSTKILLAVTFGGMYGEWDDDCKDHTTTYAIHFVVTSIWGS